MKYVAFGALVVGVTLFVLKDWNLERAPENAPLPAETRFSVHGLNTDTSTSSIDLALVFSGGPGKDGIPALSNPTFVPIDEANVGDETLGAFVTVGKEKRFYPYNILVWHEIVNDSIGDEHFAVTFCPLCGSAIVFDRRVGGRVLTFGVSGLLYESNLLMYDRETESLWSQAKNEAVVGHFTGTKLSVREMRLITFAQLKRAHPDARVLSRETGHTRRYDVDPYAGYGLVDDLFFPVTVSDTRLPPKTIMYVVPFGTSSVAFPEAELTDESEFVIGSTTLRAKRTTTGITVTQGGTPLPGYYEMWFSWATHHQKDGVLWNVEKAQQREIRRHP